MKEYIIDNIPIILGENATDNWNIINKYNKENVNYIWIHLNSFPSPHVIILDENANIKTINHACNLCQKNSKYKNMKDLKFCMTTLNNIIKGEKIGEVYFKSNRKVKTFNLNLNHHF